MAAYYRRIKDEDPDDHVGVLSIRGFIKLSLTLHTKEMETFDGAEGIEYKAEETGGHEEPNEGEEFEGLDEDYKPTQEGEKPENGEKKKLPKPCLGCVSANSYGGYSFERPEEMERARGSNHQRALVGTQPQDSSGKKAIFESHKGL